MQCVILAGGLATRMRPLTEQIPKSLIKIGDAPFLHYQLSWLSNVGVSEVVLSVGYKGELIREYAGNGEQWGLDINYVNEGSDLRGTAGALRLALDQGALADEFMVTYGDSFLPVNFEEIWRSFLQGFRPALMTVYKNQGKWDTSNVLFENDQVLLYDKFRKQPEQISKLKYIDYGLSAFKRSVIEFGIPKEGKSDLADLFYVLSQSGELAGFEVNTRFYEIGSGPGLQDFSSYIEKQGMAGCFSPHQVMESSLSI